MRSYYFTHGLLLLISLTIFDVTSARTCPPPARVQSVTLIDAYQDPYDPECWNFISNSFSHEGVIWNISFGTFLPAAGNKKEALKLGNAFFKSAELINPEPSPVEIPNHWYCQYMPEGRTYWIAAVSPPENIG